MSPQLGSAFRYHGCRNDADQRGFVRKTTLFDATCVRGLSCRIRHGCRCFTGRAMAKAASVVWYRSSNLGLNVFFFSCWKLPPQSALSICDSTKPLGNSPFYSATFDEAREYLHFCAHSKHLLCMTCPRILHIPFGYRQVRAVPSLQSRAFIHLSLRITWNTMPNDHRTHALETSVSLIRSPKVPIYLDDVVTQTNSALWEL